MLGPGMQSMQRPVLGRIDYRSFQSRAEQAALIGDGVMRGPGKVDADLAAHGGSRIVGQRSTQEIAGGRAEVLMQAAPRQCFERNQPQVAALGVIYADDFLADALLAGLGPWHRCHVVYADRRSSPDDRWCRRLATVAHGVLPVPPA